MVTLDAERLVFEYPGPLRAVDGISVRVAPGDFRCVLGPNGSGKTTLSRLLCGLLVPDAGSAKLEGRPVCHYSSRERARLVARVPQTLARIPDVRVLDFVMGGRYSRSRRFRRLDGQDLQVARESLRRADVDTTESRTLTELSGGQLQRVLVARALAQEASLLVVDEPTSALDPAHRIAVFQILARLAGEGHGVIVMTHELNLASQFATEIILLDGGRVVARGDAPSVLIPTVLEPVYGSHFRYGKAPGRDGGPERPWILPWAP